MTYAEYCKTKCVDGCGQGKATYLYPVIDCEKSWYHERIVGHVVEKFPCTAPTRDQFEQELQHIAATEMLARVRASLREYPNGGGDIEVMREVDRIVAERISELERENADLKTAAKNWEEIAHREGRAALAENSLMLTERELKERALRENAELRKALAGMLKEYRDLDLPYGSEAYRAGNAAMQAERNRYKSGLDMVARAVYQKEEQFEYSSLDMCGDIGTMLDAYREKNACGHYKRFQIVDTDPESACAACEIDRICREYSDLEAQLEAMRAERDHFVTLATAERLKVDRLRKALEEIAALRLLGPSLARIARRALNPQPTEAWCAEWEEYNRYCADHGIYGMTLETWLVSRKSTKQSHGR